MTESFAQLFEQSLANQRIRPGMILTGLIVDVGDDMVIVNVGLKSEAVIPLEQFKNERGEIEVKAGDSVEVALDAVEDGTGETRLSREKAKRARTWTRLEESFNKSEIVTGIITGRVKGGFTVEIENVRAFLPGSLVDVRPVRDTAYLENKPLEFKVIKLDQKRNNVVVSRRAVVEQEFSAERSALMDNLQEGAVRQGHRQEPHRLRRVRGSRRHRRPAAHHRHGVEARQASVGSRQGRRRDRRAHPQVRSRAFARLASASSSSARIRGRTSPAVIRRNTRVFGKVTNIADYGAFVEIEDGVEGLVHVSEMDWTNKNVNPAKVVHTGQEVEVMVLDVDEERRRISLGLKQCKAEPVEGVRRELQPRRQGVGPDQVDHRLRHLHRPRRQHRRPRASLRHLLGRARRGSRAQLPEGPAARGDGAVHRSGARAHLARHQAARARIRSATTSPRIRRARSCAARSRKWTRAARSSTSATASKASCAPRELGRDRVEDARTVLKEGEEVEAKFTGVDRKTRTISLSIKAKEMHEEQEAVSELPLRAALVGHQPRRSAQGADRRSLMRFQKLRP